MDRSYIATCLNKAIAYLNVGKKNDAQIWFDKLKAEFVKEGLK